MKKITAMIAVLAVLFCSMSACGPRTYEDAYDEGYNDGYSDAEFKMDDKCQEWYDFGYDDGQRDGEWLEYKAIHYAREQTGWSPEEAMMIIDAYRNSEPFWEDGYPPSYEDYLDAIDTLMYFYDYFYSRMYK